MLWKYMTSFSRVIWELFKVSATVRATVAERAIQAMHDSLYFLGLLFAHLDDLAACRNVMEYQSVKTIIW